METVFLVLGIIGGIVVGFAATYFTLVTKLQKKLDSAKSKLGRAKSASEDAETLQFQLEAQKGETQALQARLEAIEADHQTQLEGAQMAQAAAIAQLTADKTALENELQSLREFAPSPEQLPPDNSEALAALQARLVEMEQEHQAAVRFLEADYQAQIASLQESLSSPPEPVAEFLPPETEEFADLETQPLSYETENLGQFEVETENVVTEEFLPTEALDSPFDQVEVETENWVDAPEESNPLSESPFDLAPAVEMEAEAPVLEELEAQTPDLTAELPELADFSPAVEEAESPFGESLTPEEDLENWVDAPEETTSEELSLDLGLEMPESSATTEVEEELPDLAWGATSGETPMDLGTELPDMTEPVTPSSMEYGFGTSGEDVIPETEQTGDELLAELTGEAATSEFSLFTEAPAEEGVEDLDLGSAMPSEEILFTPEDAGNDDLDFLLELREEEELVAFPGEELLPEFSDQEPISAGFPSMEVLAEESSDFSDLLETSPESYGGDPFINILDEDPNSSDNDLLALLQNNDGNDGEGVENQGDDDLFPGLESMLGESSPGDGFDDLDALLGGGENIPSSETGEVLSLDDFDFGSDDPK